ncbi:MAG: signal peptidase I [Endomicrobiales bacterium]|nr:signal peptidase I [Endomicrobiales bacterium]
MEFKLLIAGAVLFVVAQVLRLVKPRMQETRFKRIFNEIHEWIETGWSAVLLAAFLMYFFIQAFKIPSGSMRTTLLEGDHLFVNKFIYGFHLPLSDGKRFWPLKDVKRGDIVVFRCPPLALTQAEREDKIDKDFIKRCVAVGGDRVLIKDKKLYVNGEFVVEPHASYSESVVYPYVKLFPTNEEYQRAWEKGKFEELPAAAFRDNFGPVTVPPGHYMVMGDNRDRSFDSRFWGPLPDKYLKGRALFLYWPVNRMRLIK